MATQIPEPAEIGELLENAYKEIAAGFPARAEPVLRDAIRVLPDQTTGVETCLLKLGEICAERGHYADAIRLNLRLLHDLKLRHGEANPKVLATMQQLAALYENSGRFEEAEFFRTRLACLEENIVETPMAEAAETAEDIPGDSAKSREDPAWLSKAFDEANQLYGKPEAAAPAILANIHVLEEEKTAYYQHPDIEEEGLEKLNLPYLNEQTKDPDASKSANSKSPNNLSRLPKDSGSITVPPIVPKATQPENKAESVRQAQDLKSGNHDPIDRAALRELEEKYHKRSSSEHIPTLPTQAKSQYTSQSGLQSGSKKQENHGPEFSQIINVTASTNTADSGGNPECEPREKTKLEATAEVQNLAWQLNRLLSAILQYAGIRKPASAIGSGIPSGGTVSHVDNLRHMRSLPESSISKTRQSMDLPPDSELTEYLKNMVRWCSQNLKKLRDKNNFIRACVFFVVFLLVGWGLADRFIPRAVSAADIYANCPVSYRTANGDVQFRLSDTKMCQLKTNKYAVQKPYSMYLNDWRDITAIILEQPLHKQRWLLRTPEGLQSDDGPVLYYTGGPELQLADALEHLADETNTFYGTYSSYPNSTQGLTRLVYQNPYTGREEMPTFRHVVIESLKVPSEKLLGSLLAKISKDEQKPAPGTINLCTIALRSNAGTRRICLIRAFDRNGEPLSGSVPGTIDYIASENGGRLTPDSSQDLLFWGNAIRPEQYWLIERGTDENTLFWLRWGSSIILGFTTVFLYGLYKLVQPENQTKDILLFLIRTSSALTVVLAWLEHAL